MYIRSAQDKRDPLEKGRIYQILRVHIEAHGTVGITQRLARIKEYKRMRCSFGSKRGQR